MDTEPTRFRLESMNPFRPIFGTVGYLGQLAILAIHSLLATVRPAGSVSFVRSTLREVDRLLVMGIPLVGMVHVGMGSFLSMQAYFGATFVDGIGPVTGVGLIRNLAPLLTGFLLAGLVAARYVGDFRGRAAGFGDLEEARGIDTNRLVATRIAASMVAGPILAAWGSAVGIGVGFLAARSMMGITVPAFFDMFLEMLWIRDVIGLVVKGVVFGGMAGLFACHEGLRWDDERGGGSEAICSAACRAACLACLAILAFNSAWFLLIYHAGPAFGPTVLTPPTMD